MRTAAFWLLVAILGIGSWAVDYLDTSDESAQPIYHRNGDALEKMHDDDDLSFEGSAEKEYLPYYHGDGPHSINLHKREAHCREDVDVTYPQELIDEAERHEYIIDVYTASPSPPVSRHDMPIMHHRFLSH
uniref:Putative secreted protein ovary overexpressed n=1 Tax=Rhipicephalus microplus TaxID=6941 RepID=A0A6M2D8M7_RHIMP